MKIIKNNQAFTLIEVLASITILGIVLTVFLSFFSNATLFSSKTEDKLTAINYADKALYDVKNNMPDTNEIDKCGTGTAKLLDSKDFQMNNKTYVSKITGCKEIYNDSGNTQETDLIRLHVEILSDQNKVITVLYDYYEVDSSDNNGNGNGNGNGK